MKLEPYKAELHVDGEVLGGPTFSPRQWSSSPSEMTEEQRLKPTAPALRNPVTLSRSDQMALAHQFKIRSPSARLLRKECKTVLNQERISQLRHPYVPMTRQPDNSEALAKTPFINGK